MAPRISSLELDRGVSHEVTGSQITNISDGDSALSMQVRSSETAEAARIALEGINADPLPPLHDLERALGELPPQ